MLDLLWIKIEERFHNMADGYRFFDVNHDNHVNFAEFQKAIDKLRINFQITQLDMLFRALDRGNKGYISYGDFCELAEERRRKIDAFKTPKKEEPASPAKDPGAVKEFLHKTPIAELERANKRWSTPMRRWRAKRESSLPPLIQDNVATHIFGKPSVDAETDIRVGPLIKNDFNRSYLEEQQEKQAQLKLELIKHNMKHKDHSNKVSRLRSQSVAKKMQQREMESFDFQAKIREQ